MRMLGFELGFWDFATFLSLAVLVLAGVVTDVARRRRAIGCHQTQP